ncbi:DUF6300 family protein [Streptomyces chartreusis]|uniref:DUF6300 family protein n=1 Tax=Streptomyces chartreusis TaxID=1969 RepID=UPI003645D552
MFTEWRYVVRPDGSFWRTPNYDGYLDGVPDEELAGLGEVVSRHGEEDSPCSRCGRILLLHWVMPQAGVLMELCGDCDSGRQAASDMIGWIRDPARRPQDLPLLFEVWQAETMEAMGFHFVPFAEDPPEQD